MLKIQHICLLAILLFCAASAQIFAQVPRDLQGNLITTKDTDYPIPAGAYFVSPGGSNQNPGSQAAPWQTFTYALEHAPNGATIIFRAGTYRPEPTASDRSRMVAVNKRLTLQPYPHEQVWIKGSEVVTGWVADGSAWRHDNWPYSFGANTGSENVDPAYPQALLRDMVFVDGRALSQVMTRQEVTAGTFYVDPTGRALYLGDNPAGRTVESGAMERALWMGWGYTEAANTVVRGLGFAHFTEIALEFGTPNITLENNTFVWNASTGAGLLGSAPGSNSRAGSALNCTVRGNTFSYNGRKGFDASMAHGTLIEDNTFSYNNIERFNGGWDAAGLKVTGIDDMVFRRNLVENNYSMGLWMDIGVRRAKVLQNVVRHNSIIGIFFEISNGALIAGNLSHNNGESGIQISNSANARIFNNTLVNNGRALVVNETERPGAGKTEEYTGQSILLPNWVTQGNVAKNNILANGGTIRNMPSWQVQDVLEAFNWPLNPSDPPMFDALDYNFYYRTSSTQPAALARWTENRTGDIRELYTLAELQQRVGVESHGLNLDNTGLNSLFVDVSQGNYQLVSNSAAKGSGEPLPSEVAQALGVTPGVAVDRGAILTSNTTQVVADGIYKLTSKVSAGGTPLRCLDVSSSQDVDGRNVQLWEANPSNAQRWKIEHTGDNFYKLTALVGNPAGRNNRVLDAAGGPTAKADGTNVQIWTDFGNDNQRWKIEQLGNGYYKLTAKHTWNDSPRKVLDVYGGYNVNGGSDPSDPNKGNVIIWQDKGSDNQQWRIESATAARITAQAQPTTTETALVNLSPNPASESVTLTLEATSAQTVVVKIINSQGVRAGQVKKAITAGKQQVPIPVGHYQRGLYLLQLTLDGKRHVRKLVVE